MPPRYTEEFKREAVKQVTVNGYGVKDTAQRLGVHFESLRSWIKKYESPESNETLSDKAEIKRLQKELRRVTEERDILKKAAAYFASHTD
jgi:transposase